MEFEQGAYVECTHDHKFYIGPETSKQAQDIAIGNTVVTTEGDIKLLNKIDLGYSEPVYDLIEVNGGHRYYTNKILSSNCEFLVFDETLIHSIKLATMEGEAPLLNMGHTRWFKKPSSKYSYVVSLDPAMGTGGNNAALQIYEIPTYEQVGEWCHNETGIPGQVRVLKDICQYIADETKSGGDNIYWSVENNGLGEAALIVINDYGEENIPGLFISEPMRKGHVRKFRKGFNTTHGAKMTICARLKTMIENDQLLLRSRPLISELKNYVKSNTSFQAKQGHGDDLVSATLLALRMITVIKDWDPSIYNTFIHLEPDEDYEQPMPIFVSSSF